VSFEEGEEEKAEKPAEEGAEEQGEEEQGENSFDDPISYEFIVKIINPDDPLKTKGF